MLAQVLLCVAVSLLSSQSVPISRLFLAFFYPYTMLVHVADLRICRSVALQLCLRIAFSSGSVKIMECLFVVDWKISLRCL